MAELTKFAQNLAVESGIGRLMDDLGRAIRQDGQIMLGGGNPARIPEVQACFQDRLIELTRDGQQLGRILGDYDPPQGNAAFIHAISQLLRDQFGWPIGPEHVALTHGSQSAFFALFNMFGGTCAHGRKKRILFPLAPEYIGYCDMGLEPDIFTANRPQIEYGQGHFFKYHVDFETLPLDDSIGAICVSRPTNPTGNVLTDREVAQLSRLAAERDIPLVLDNAYGMPFPGVVFTDARPIYDDHVVLCMSLSKLGLPALRTGIVVARPEIIRMISHINAVVSLAPGGLGAAIVLDLVQSGQILKLSQEVIKPYYLERQQFALNCLQEVMQGLNYYVHQPEGAFFLWVWLPDLSITSLELYERLKKRGVIVVPGEYFFPGMEEPWPHKHQCLRINYAQPADKIEKGFQVIAQEIKACS